MNDFERMISGRLYNAGSPDIDKIHQRGMTLCDRFNRLPLTRMKAKERTLYKLIPTSKENELVIFPPFYCEYGVNIRVGKECFVNYNCTFLDIAPITLEDFVWIGANVTLATPMHPFIAEERIMAEYPDGYHDLEYARPITLKKNVWVCSSATIIGGVTVGENSIVAAGAVVTKDVPPNSIVAGVPARVVREIDEDDRLNVWETYINDEIPMSKRDKEKNS
ncbi:MAG: sugar O-acetyltransferase [Ruminococcaceae bacterium]|nr:sugar O-acetyltransferase [Oscillospiraceae bacterium]